MYICSIIKDKVMKKIIILAIGVGMLYMSCNAYSIARENEDKDPTPEPKEKEVEGLEEIEIIKVEEIVIEKTNTLNHYIKAVGFAESGNRYDIVNPYGYKGRYQFGYMALKDLNLHKLYTREFLDNRKLQDTAFISLLSINRYRLRKYSKYVGRTINGVKITMSGMLASAHLVGAGSVRRWLRSNGKRRSQDANGTTIENYMSKFAGYDMSSIIAIRTIKLN